MRQALSETQKRQFSGMVLLDRVCTNPRAFHAALLEQEDDHLLDDTFKYLLSEGVVDIGDDDFYIPTAAGRRAYQAMVHRQQSYLIHFDVFARVDLAAGVFANQERDYLEDERWDDLRVAVAEYKGIDPYRMVFLALLAEERFFAHEDWKFDLALGSSFFREMEDIVATQIAVQDLGYVAEDGARVPGETVIEDVILQGAAINADSMERERNRQQTIPEEFDPEEDAPQGPVGGNGTGESLIYDPWGPLQAYQGSPTFAEPIWHAPFW